MVEHINKKQDASVILQKRSDISNLLMQKAPNIKSSTITSMSASDLRLMLELYDRIFFDNRIKDSFKGKFLFSLSLRMTKSAGMTICPKNISEIKPEDLIIEIRIGVDFFFNHSLVGGARSAGGIKAENSLQALQLVFEHELCHAIEFILFNKSNCSGERFKAMARNVFGHTESHHELPTHMQLVSQKLGLKIGDPVQFVFEGRKLNGVIHSIKKRVAVMVKDKNGLYTDKQGNRYMKYFVPINMLNTK